MTWKYDKDKITYFAETDFRGQRVKFGIRAEDRARHMYIIGKTGMGKSTLLENLAIQDILNDEGMCFIDPHGGTAEALLAYVPEHRIKDVVYFAPHEMDFPVALNVLENDDPNKRPLIASGILSTFKKVWPDAWSGRMEYFLMNTLLALLETPGSTLLGVNRMYSDAAYREKVISNITDTSVRAFWVDEYANMTEKMVAEATPAIQNKVGQFSMNPIMRNILGQSESTFDIRWLMDNRKIFIVNLSKGRVGETNAALLGALLVTKIYLAAMSRADMDPETLKAAAPFYLFVDEFQNFANDSFANILSEARKYKLALTIAHQYIEQMPEEVRNAVFGNVGTMITFRIGAGDAENIEKEFAPVFTAEDIVGLGFAQIYLKLMIKGAASTPFSARTSDRPEMPSPNFASAAAQASRDQFARPRAEVEEVIKEWFISDKSKPAFDDGRPGAKKFAPGSRPPSAGGSFGAGPRSGPGSGAPRRDTERSGPGQQAEGGSLAAALAQAGLASKSAPATKVNTAPVRRDDDDEDEVPRRATSSPVSSPVAVTQAAAISTSTPVPNPTPSVPLPDMPVAQMPPQGQIMSPQQAPSYAPPQYGAPMGPIPPQPYYPPQQHYYPSPAPAYPPQYYPQQYYPQSPYPPQSYYPQPMPHYGYALQPMPQPVYQAPLYQPYPPLIHYSPPPAPSSGPMSVPPANPLPPHEMRERTERSEPRMPQMKSASERLAERRELSDRFKKESDRLARPEAKREERPKEERVREERTRSEVKREDPVGVSSKSEVQKPRAETPLPETTPAREPVAPPISPTVLERKPEAQRSPALQASERKPEKIGALAPKPFIAKRDDGKGPSEVKMDALAAALAKLSASKVVTTAEVDDGSAPVLPPPPKLPRTPIPMKPPVAPSVQNSTTQSGEVPKVAAEVPLDVLRKVLE